MIRKKAQGEIITTVLIILLILAAIVIVWQVVQSTVSRGGEQAKGQASCVGLNYVIVKANTTGLQIRRDTGAPDIASFTAKVFVDGADTGKTITIGGELNTTKFPVGPTPPWAVGSKIQLAPVVGGIQCDLGPEKLIQSGDM